MRGDSLRRLCVSAVQGANEGSKPKDSLPVAVGGAAAYTFAAVQKESS